MNMDNIILFAKNVKELETLIQAVRIYDQDIEMEYGIEKCAMLIMKSGKWQLTEGIELSNQGKIRTLREKETYKYLEISEADAIKHAEMKEKIKKKNPSSERENYSKPNYVVEILSYIYIHTHTYTYQQDCYINAEGFFLYDQFSFCISYLSV